MNDGFHCSVCDKPNCDNCSLGPGESAYDDRPKFSYCESTSGLDKRTLWVLREYEAYFKKYKSKLQSIPKED